MYNPFYPQSPQLYQPNYPQSINQQPQQTTPQIQNGGFVSIPNEDMVNSYPVGMGNCVTFKVEGKPIVLEKSVGFSQFEAPRIKKFRLVEEVDTMEQRLVQTEPKSNDEIEQLKSDIESLQGEIDAIKKQLAKKPVPKKNDDGDD